MICNPTYTIPSSPNSTILGTLSPISEPLDSQHLVLLFQNLFTSILSFDPKLIVEFNQTEPGPMPASTVDWMSQGIEIFDDETSTPFQTFEEGRLSITYNQRVLNLCTFYGPNRWNVAQRLKFGLSLAQNRQPLSSRGISLTSFSEQRNTSILIQNKWQKITNYRLAFKRLVTFVYPVDPIESLAYNLHTN